MSFHEKPVFVLFVGVKEGTGVPPMSEAPKRLASRRPSRPKVLLPVARVKFALMLGIVGNPVVITDAGFTLPLWGAAAILPKPTVAVLPAPVP